MTSSRARDSGSYSPRRSAATSSSASIASRLGRDAIEVTLVVRDLVRDRGCRLYYYATGHEVQFANAIDQATTFIQGTGHQMELEAIRSRTREALRSRVRNGQIAGGICFGYKLDRGRPGGPDQG
jgi:DNA invertase Pin-like site-specific DNA recombinase